MSANNKEPDTVITRKDSMEGLYRLSGLQHGILFHGLYAPESGAYVNHLKSDLINPDVEVFKKCWEYLLKGHSILRSVFYHDKLSTPVQCVFKEAKMLTYVLDYRNMSSEEQEIAIKEYEDADIIKGFDFNTAPLLRVALIRLDEVRYKMILTHHHIILDGWSISILLVEFLNIYESLISGKEVKLIEPDNFEDFIRYIERTDKKKAQQYWKTYLRNIETGTQLPFIGKTAERTKGEGEYRSLYLDLDSELTKRIQDYAKRNRITVNTVMQGVWSYCLHRYTGNKDLVFGVIVSGRPDDFPRVEHRVGLFVNPLPLHSEMGEGQKIQKTREWLQELQKDQFSSRQYQHTALHEISSWTGIQGDMFECLLTFENYPVSEALSKQKWNLQIENVQTTDKNNYPLTIIISLGGQIKIRFSYNTVLLKEEYVNGIKRHFEHVLLQFIENEDCDLRDIAVLTEEEKNELSEDFNISHSEYPADKTIVDLFESQVFNTPDAKAVIFDGGHLTFKELDERSNRLAHYLRRKGVEEGTLVPIFMDPGTDVIVSILGILKSGGAYVPIDVDIPQERIGYILNDTCSSLIISNSKNKSRLTGLKDVETIEIDNHWSGINKESSDKVKNSITPDNLAYVIYTSGSTGKPKGVMIGHRSLVDYVFGLEDKLKMSACDSFAMVSGIATDLGNTVLYGSLLTGGTLHMFSKAATSDAEFLNKYFNGHRIDCLKIVPSHWKALCTEDELLLPAKLLIFGGEVLPAELTEKIRMSGSDCRVVNHYGPTETTIGKLLHIVDWKNKYDTTIPVGRPFSNTAVYVLDKDLSLCPIGIPGQLYIAGDGVAAGYLNNPELTNEQFIGNPFHKHSLMYATGDLVKFLPDGNIEFIGRADDQVKIRGFRIELGEIENAAKQCELVNDAIVLAREDKQGGKRLVGYIVAENEFNREAITSYLKEKLPDYMVPALLIEMKSFPLTANGKIDKKALPDPDNAEVLSSEFAAPRNEAEKTLTEIWQELLDLETVGIHDNFFELGGDSIVTIQLVSRARRAGFELQVGDVFTYQTISRLSALLEQRSDKTLNVSGEQFTLSGSCELLPIQQWYFEKDSPELSHFNQGVLLGIDKTVTESILKRAVEQLYEHHDALRFKYYKKDNRWQQVYGPESEISEVKIVDLRNAEEDKLRNLISERADHFQRSLDIEKGELMRVVLIQTPSSDPRNRLLIIIHHLAVDGVSWRILLEDLELLISGLKSAASTDLGSKSSSYRQWYEALKEYGQSERLISQKEYWTTINKIHEIDKIEDEIRIKEIAHHVIKLSSGQTQRLLQEVPRVYHTEINDILLSALAKTLCEFNKTDNVVIELEGHGREVINEGNDNIDLSRTVGWFTSHYPVLLEYDKDKGEDDLIKSVKEQLRRVPDKGLGYGVLRYINGEESLRDFVSPDLLFNYLGQSDNVLGSSQWFTLADEPMGAGVSDDYRVSNKLSVNGLIQEGKLVLNWGYSKRHFDKQAIQKLAEEFQSNLESLIDHCASQEKAGIVFTPSDYGLGKEINYAELDRFLNEPFNGKARRESIEGLYRLSGLQQGMLFHGLYDGGADSYIRQLKCDLTSVNLEVLKKSWKVILKRHSILRSAFYPEAFNIPVQCVYSDADLPVEIFDLRNKSEKQQEEAVTRYLNSEVNFKGFDFSSAPLMRIGMMRLDDERCRMIWTWHHILFDGWSMPILFEEFLNTYEELLSGKEVIAKDEDLYEDYIRYLERGDKRQQKSYWDNYMKGIEQSTLLPFIKSTTLRTKGIGEYETFSSEFDENTSKQVERFTQSNHITINTLMQGVWSYLLHRYTGSNEIAYGVTVSGRPDDLPEVEKRVGMFINTIPLHSKLDKEKKISRWLKEIQEEQVSSRQYQYTPLHEIQRWTGVQGDLFDSILVFENYPVSKLIGSKQWSIQMDNMQLKEQANYPLTLLIGNSEKISIDFNYNTALLSENYVRGISAHFGNVLRQIISNEDKSLNEIDLLTEPERHQLIYGFNDTEADYPGNKTIVDLFEEQASKTPDDTALVFEEIQMTFKELSERSSRLAHYLKSKGVGRETLVPICIGRNIDMITGILGILKSGGAYVPIDPEYPEERIRFMIKDSGGSLILSNKECISKLPVEEGLEVISLDVDWSEINKYASENPEVEIKPDQLAYVIYTSGSTGTPKGVMIEHRNLTAYLLNNKTRYIAKEAGSGTFIHLSYTFDASITGIFMPLLSGKSVVIGSNDSLDVFEDENLLKYAPYDFIKITPSHLDLLQSKFETDNVNLTKRLVIGGEALLRSKFNYLSEKGIDIEIINEYGPTEATVGCSVYDFNILNDDDPENNISIGKPIDNVQMYILDEDKEPVPAGVSGEIYISGDGLARGYLNRPELTSEKFIPNPFKESSSSVMYRTGDLGRWLPDGNLEYIGRADDQVKIRGYRIEPGEIESVIQESELVDQCVVIVKEDGQLNKRLIAFVVVKEKIGKEVLMNYLRNRLPEYMIPAVWVEMETLPLTPNGKIDRRALLESDTEVLLSAEYAAPQNDTEEKLAAIWSELLHRDRIGIHDNFFELGGDSIVTLQVVSRARRIGYELKPKDIFVYQTIGSLSKAIAGRSALAITGEQGLLSGKSGLLPIQQSYFHGAGEKISHFNQSVLLSIDRSVTPEMLEKAVELLMAHHDALRFRYFKNDGEWNQEYGNEKGELITVDLMSAKKSSLKGLIEEEACKYQKSLDLENGVIARFVLMQTPEKETHNRIFIVIHHLAVDGVSWRILLDDLELLLTGLQKNEKTDLGPKSSSYRQWYEALKLYGQSNRLLSQSSFWKETEGSYEPLTVDKPYKGAVTVKDLKTETIRLDTEKTQLLLTEIPRTYHTEINDILLSALAMTLCDWISGDKVIIGLEGHGREHIAEDIDTSRTVGWFTSLYPVLLELTPERNLSDVIKSVKEQLRRIPDKGLGYGVTRYINNEGKASAEDCWNIVFNYLGKLDNVVNSGKLLSGAGESRGANASEEQKISNNLTVNAMVQGGELILNWSYSSKHYKKGTITDLLGKYRSNLESLISHCMEQRKSGEVNTPSDYGLGAEISYAELDKFLDEPINGVTRRDSIEGLYRLSGLQQGMLFHALYDSRAGAYTEQLMCDLISPDIEIINKSWKHILNIHSILRSGFYNDEFTIPVQCVYKDIELPVTVLDFSNMASAEQTLAIKEYEESDRLKGFDFKSVPLMRIALIKLSEDRYKMLWTSHHILFDGWSLQILMEEFLNTYELLASGRDLPEKEEDRYEDYIRYIERDDKDLEEKYWRNYMKGLEQSTLLPFISTTAQRTKGVGEYEMLNLNLNEEVTALAEKFTRKHRITTNTLMQGVWSYLLHSYTGNKNVAYGIIVSGRPDDLPGVEQRVGMYINTLPLHSVMKEEMDIVQWLQSLQDSQVSSHRYQRTPLQNIQSRTGIQGDLFDSLLVFENYPVNEILRSKDWKLKVENLNVHEQTNYPLTIIIGGRENMFVRFSYNAGLLEEDYVKEIANHFENVLMQAISNEKKLLCDIELMTTSEEIQILSEFNNTDADYPKDKSVIKLFEEQAARTPDDTALVFEDRQLTYQELNERSNQLGHFLRSKGVMENTLVPVCIERSIEMIIGISGILKAGGAYVPVDPELPEDRIKFMLEDINSNVIVSSKNTDIKLPIESGYDVIELDTHWSDISKESTDNLQSKSCPEDLTYVLYTSGSTGYPKGVLMPGRGLVNLLNWQQKQFTNKKRNVLQFANLNFDVSFQEIFSTLCYGGTLFLIDAIRRIDLTALLNDIVNFNITHLFIPYVVLRNLAENIPPEWLDSYSLEEIIVAGEQLKITDELDALLFEGKVRLINQYGPTEAHVVSSYRVECKGSPLPPVGKPIDNTKLYILRDNQPVPVGVPGELYIGGVPVADGYLNRPELTKEKFVNDPFSKKEGSKMYSTGDLARWLPDGNIEYLGREDHQVKIRGYRIELGEIESKLQQSNMIKEAAVLAKEDRQGNKRLVGYIVTDGKYEKEELIVWLKNKIPDYMVPSIWVELESLPLNRSGKIDRLNLPEPDTSDLVSGKYVAPRNETEEKLAKIWSKLLNIEKVGIHDDFFDLGGHSILAMRVISAIRKEFNLNIPIKILFEFTSIEDLGKYIELAISSKEKSVYSEAFDL